MSQTVLVLGASGFIGGHIARAALAHGWTVRGLRRSAAVGHLTEPEIEWYTGDLADPDSLVAAMQGCEVVFHAAAYYPSPRRPRPMAEHLATGAQEIQNVLAACRQAGVSRLVYTSSLTTIDQPPPSDDRLADERDTYQPENPPASAYHEVKILMENAVLAANGPQLEIVVTNPTAVFGPGDVHLTLSPILIAAARGLVIGWLPVSINIIDVRDVAVAHIAAAGVGRPGQRYILGGHNLPVKTAFTTVAKIAGVRPPFLPIPFLLIDLFVFIGRLLPFLHLPVNHIAKLRRWQGYNTERAERELGLTARRLEQTITDALAWLRENGHL
ncbi:MAG: NAD-dependent epimerase/dehydratase family protein [Anaerolineae bacterium]|nr:MAG: NAD-dependent epimerase/dehydratase family protein [Anaerolineae bacterium]